MEAEVADEVKAKIKSFFYVTIFITGAVILAWGIWFNYRPQVVLAACADMAEKSTVFSAKRDIYDNPTDKYDRAYNDCLRNSGIY